MQWIKLTDRMPNLDEHGRVLVYTEGYDFNGEQVFDVKAETLNECFYADPDDQPEVCKVATHWNWAKPTGSRKSRKTDTQDFLTRARALKSEGRGFEPHRNGQIKR
jgi:hypothetical protein